MAYIQNPGRGPMQKTGRGIPQTFKSSPPPTATKVLSESLDGEIKLTPEMKKYAKNQPAAKSTGEIYQTPEDNSDGFFKQVGTLLSNPIDGIAALGNQIRGNSREMLNLSDQGDLDGVRGNLTNLRRANLSEDPSTIKELNKTAGLNFATQVGMLGSGTALGLQTINDLVQGDATGAVIKKAKVLKPVYNAVKKLGVDPTKLTKHAYKAYKANKNVF